MENKQNMFKIPFFEKKSQQIWLNFHYFVLCVLLSVRFYSHFELAISLSFRFWVVLTISKYLNSKTKNIFYESLLNTDTMACPSGVRINWAQVNKLQMFISNK